MSAVDDIQVLMDDHILKAQTMRGSPFVKAFEHETQAWEDKLLTMQDILEAWLQVSHRYFNFIFVFLTVADGRLIFSSLDFSKEKRLNNK